MSRFKLARSWLQSVLISGTPALQVSNPAGKLGFPGGVGGAGVGGGGAGVGGAGVGGGGAGVGGAGVGGGGAGVGAVAPFCHVW